MQRLQRQFNSDHQYWNLQRGLAQLVSTSNKRSSSGEMKKRPEEGDIYRRRNFDTCLDQRVWTVKLIFTPFHRLKRWWRLTSQFKLFDPNKCQNSSSYKYHPLLVFNFSTAWKGVKINFTVQTLWSKQVSKFLLL